MNELLSKDQEIDKAIKFFIGILESRGYVVTPPRKGVCSLPECGKEFFTKRGTSGAPKQKFCCGAHRDTYRDRTAAERMRRYRARKKR